MPTPQDESLALALGSSIDQLGASIGKLNALLEARVALQQVRSFDLAVPANATRSLSLPPGCGGLLIYPQGSTDMTNLKVIVGGIPFTWAANTTTPQFVPAMGTDATVAVQNAATTVQPIRYLTLPVEYATVFAALMPRQ